MNEIQHILSKGVPKRFTGGYFGVRNAEFFTEQFKSYVFKCSSFTDITAGTGQFPYSLALQGFPTFVNDRCLYSSLVLRSLFNSDIIDFKKPMDEWVSGYHVALDRTPIDGYLSKNWSVLPRAGRIFRKDTAGYIDSVCKAFQRNPLVLYAVGKTILRWTFRGHQFCSVGPRKRKLNTISPKEVRLWILEEMHGVRTYVSRLPQGGERGATYGDAVEAPRKHPVKGGFVYADPAWPWAQEFAGGNPYRFYTDILSSILAQKRQTIPAWERTHTPDQILEEIATWMEASFKAGAKHFCVCTQDTNYPDPSLVYKWMRKRFRMQRLIIIDDWSSAANRNYKNFWGIFSPK